MSGLPGTPQATPRADCSERQETDMAKDTWTGSCFCGAVQVTVKGPAAGMGYCHCTSCRHWSAGPINGFTLWSQDSVQITRGDDQLGTYQKTENSKRRWCKTCGGHVLTEHPHWRLVDVYAAVLRDFPFEPKVHV